MLKKEKYDAVLVAVGSEPCIPPIPGADGKNVVFAPDVYGNEDALGREGCDYRRRRSRDRNGHAPG